MRSQYTFWHHRAVFRSECFPGVEHKSTDANNTFCIVSTCAFAGSMNQASRVKRTVYQWRLVVEKYLTGELISLRLQMTALKHTWLVLSVMLIYYQALLDPQDPPYFLYLQHALPFQEAYHLFPADNLTVRSAAWPLRAAWPPRPVWPQHPVWPPGSVWLSVWPRRRRAWQRQGADGSSRRDFWSGISMKTMNDCTNFLKMSGCLRRRMSGIENGIVIERSCQKEKKYFTNMQDQLYLDHKKAVIIIVIIYST